MINLRVECSLCDCELLGPSAWPRVLSCAILHIEAAAPMLPARQYQINAAKFET
jgi:hypothetical protein